MSNITLEIPLPAFFFGRFIESDYSRAAWIQVFAQSLDRSTFSGSISPLEDHNDFLARFFRPALHFEQFNLELEPWKCEMFSPKVKYLGQVVSEAGVTMDPGLMDNFKV